MPDAASPVYRRKLIEVDLPLDAISQESAREKSIRHGHPSTLHLWWARRPLAACRAVIFASLVDDPSGCPDEFPTEEAQARERERLHGIIRRLVVWEDSNDGRLLNEARYEIARSAARLRGEQAPAEPDAVLRYLREHVPPVYDPFAGGGSIPLEAQRLGLRAVASDLNPVAVLLNKALIELPPKVAGKRPVNPEATARMADGVEWRGAAGLAEDIRWYGKWMRDRAWERIGHLYPKAKLPDGGEATVIAWLWARTIPCPNPACGVAMPLMATFELSRKSSNRHWVRPVVDSDAKQVSFVVQNHDEGVPRGGTVDRNGARCIACGTTAPLAYVREQSKAGRLGEQMTAIVAEGNRRRLFLSPTEDHIEAALVAEPAWRPRQKMPATTHKVSGRGYGIGEWSELFTERQLAALTTFSDLASEIRDLVNDHANSKEYADVVVTYLGILVSRLASACSSFTRWDNSPKALTAVGVFARQAIPMVWDFAEVNPFSSSSQNWVGQIDWVVKVLEGLPSDCHEGIVYQADASVASTFAYEPLIITDPPYYDNISYAELSDFFYVWLRPSLREVHPDLFSGMLVPKDEEMVAMPRFENPGKRFETLLGRAMKHMDECCSQEFPSSIFYAYKQQEEERESRASTGWETMLTAVIAAGFQIVGTWPTRTELVNRPNARDTNSLASAIVLVCRPRPEDASIGTRRQFIEELGRELPQSFDAMTRDGHIAPVDLAQAAIGPGMQVFSRYSRIERVDGVPFTVRDALREINEAIAAYDGSLEGELDAESRFCLRWLQQHGFTGGAFGDAETLAKAMNVSVDALHDAGLLEAERGAVHLYEVADFSPDAPYPGVVTAWEGCFRMAYHFSGENRQGIPGAAQAMANMGGATDSMERLARILYNHFDRRNDARRAAPFNDLVVDWERITSDAQNLARMGQQRLI